MTDVHTGPGHEDVSLSLTTETPDGGRHYRTWNICACSPLYQKLDQVLGPAQVESIATREAVEATAAAVRGVPGVVLGTGF